MLGNVPNLWLAIMGLSAAGVAVIWALIGAGWTKIVSVFRRGKGDNGTSEE